MALDLFSFFFYKLMSKLRRNYIRTNRALSGKYGIMMKPKGVTIKSFVKNSSRLHLDIQSIFVSQRRSSKVFKLCPLDPFSQTLGILTSLRTLLSVLISFSSETQGREGFILKRFEGVAFVSWIESETHGNLQNTCKV